jgi:hypothetical protein
LNKSFIFNKCTLKLNYISKEIKEYNSNPNTISIDSLQEKIFDVILKEEFSEYLKYCNISIVRYDKFMGSIQEKEHGIEEFYKLMANSIMEKIRIYCESITFIIDQRDKKKVLINNLHFHYFTKIGQLVSEFNTIFTYELKYIFTKTCKIFNNIEENMKINIKNIKNIYIKPLFDKIWFSTDNHLNTIFKDFKYKDTYVSSNQKIENLKIGTIERIVIFLKPIFTVVI